MKVITNTYYQAADDTAFDTQKDCEEYEHSLKLNNQQSKLSDLFLSKGDKCVGVSGFILGNLLN